MAKIVWDESGKRLYETGVKNLYELKTDLNTSFDTFRALYTELTDNVFKTSHECDMFVQEDCIYRLIE